MASVIYQSSQTTTNSSSSSIVVTKPASLAVGDFLVAVVANVAGSVQTINTPSGWTSRGKTDGSFTSFVVFTKIADASDVAASDFTFTFAGSTTAAAAGVARFSANNVTSEIDQVSTADTSSTSGITPIQTMSTHIICAAGWNSGANTGSFASYAIATENPTWTEAFDAGTGTQKIGVAMAYASRPSLTATGTAQYTPTDYNNLKIWIINIPPSPIPTLTTTTAINSVSIPIILNTSLSIISTLVVPTFSAVASRWNNLSKNVSSWLNTDKS